MIKDNIDPLAVVQAINSHTNYKGCYQFACLLQKLYPGSVIYSNTDHAIVEIDRLFYDQYGVVLPEDLDAGRFIPLLDSEVLERAKTWHREE